jgi:excisionase family DNA binding protein
MVRKTRSRNHSDGGSTPPRLLEPSEVAALLGCSEWWVKEQARRRRVPFTKVGGAYRFTDEHLYEIIRIFEHRPSQTQKSDDGTIPQRRAVPGRSRSATAHVQLRAQPPRRLRNAG